jgi:hypothetical protein
MFPQLFKNGTNNTGEGVREGEKADFMFYNRHLVDLDHPMP